MGGSNIHEKKVFDTEMLKNFYSYMSFFGQVVRCRCHYLQCVQLFAGIYGLGEDKENYSYKLDRK